MLGFSVLFLCFHGNSCMHVCFVMRLSQAFKPLSLIGRVASSERMHLQDTQHPSVDPWDG